MPSTNVVASVTAHVAGHNAASFAKAYPGGATPAQLGAVCGHPGKRSSALRAHVARGLGQGTQAQGITRYPPLTYGQWCALLGVAERTAQGKLAPADATVRAGKVWAAARMGGKQAKRQAQASAPAQEATAQAS